MVYTSEKKGGKRDTNTNAAPRSLNLEKTGWRVGLLAFGRATRGRLELDAAGLGRGGGGVLPLLREREVPEQRRRRAVAAVGVVAGHAVERARVEPAGGIPAVDHRTRRQLPAHDQLHQLVAARDAGHGGRPLRLAAVEVRGGVHHARTADGGLGVEHAVGRAEVGAAGSGEGQGEGEGAEHGNSCGGWGELEMIRVLFVRERENSQKILKIYPLSYKN